MCFTYSINVIFISKSFVFAKISKFSKTVLPYLATWSRVNPIACPQLTQKFFATHWRVKVLVTKILKAQIFEIFLSLFHNWGLDQPENCQELLCKLTTCLTREVELPKQGCIVFEIFENFQNKNTFQKQLKHSKIFLCLINI